MTVELFIPCFIDQLYPETAFNVVKILEKLKVNVRYNPKQTCCGQFAYNMGYWEEAREIAEKFITEYREGKYIVIPSASCAAMVRNAYLELMYNTGSHNDCKHLQKSTFELTDFIVNVMQCTDLGATFEKTATYHHSCAASREYGLKDEPRLLLANVRGLELREMNESDVCCGFGGSFSIKHEPISTAMGKQKVENAMATGAEYLVSTEASCLMHLEGYLQKHKIPMKTIHIADVLASGL